MLLRRNLWESFSTYLFYDRKFSTKSSAKNAVFSRFNKICDHFSKVEFNRENFNLFIRELKDKGYKNTYLNKFVSLGKHLDKFLGINQLQDYTYFREDRVLTCDTLTPEDIEQIATVEIPYKKYRKLLNQRYKALYWLFGTSGCRVSEALNLRYSDIHASPCYVIYRDTKNGSSRIVNIGSELYNLIMDLPHHNENDLVFRSTRNNKKLNSQEINLDLKRRANTIGIRKRIWCHLFRHSFISEMGKQGVDTLHIAYLVGHKDLRNTQRYFHGSLEFYNEVVHRHPLLRKEITWNDVIKKIKNQITTNIDTSRFNLSLKETRNKVVIELVNLNH